MRLRRTLGQSLLAYGQIGHCTSETFIFNFIFTLLFSNFDIYNSNILYEFILYYTTTFWSEILFLLRRKRKPQNSRRLKLPIRRNVSISPFSRNIRLSWKFDIEHYWLQSGKWQYLIVYFDHFDSLLSYLRAYFNVGYIFFTSFLYANYL